MTTESLPGDFGQSQITGITPTGPDPSRMVGSYRLLQRLGEGGMGEVWLAQQVVPVQRQVAIKVVKAGMDSARVVARFDAERQALALMDHPAIAKVFDAGTTPEGRLYFAMEYVRGESITTYCDRQRLSVRERLELFIQLCDGVQHAHQKGIIHRDLKPSNVLVAITDDHPAPRIIDFGIAKAVAQPLTEHSLFTELGTFLGTPEYMSPEQAEMTPLDVDTRSDVYSLGLLLYELLVGTLPFDRQALRQAGLDEMRRTIRETDAPRPSTRVTRLGPEADDTAAHRRTQRHRLAGLLRGDLDWITMKALEKDRTRRYATANALGMDLRRHLANEPVMAGPPSATYRTGKFVRRHRVGVAAVASLVILLAAFAAAMTVQAGRIARERDRANHEATSARQVSDFMVGLFKVSDPNEARGNTLTAREVLDKGAAGIERTLSEQPEVQARLQATIGNVYTNLGLYGQAEQLLQRSLTNYRRIAGNDATETLSTLSALADVYFFLGRLADAESIYSDIVKRRLRLLGPDHPDTLKATFDLASAYGADGRLKEAEDLTRKTLEIQRRILGHDHPDTLASLNNLGAQLQYQNRYNEAVAVNAEVLAIRRRVFGPDHPDTLRSFSNLGSTYARLGRLDEAESHLLVAAEGRRRVLGETHPATLWTVTRLAKVYWQQRKYGQAERELLALVELLHLKETGHSQIRSLNAEGNILNLAEQIADFYAAWGNSRKAAEWRARIATSPTEPQAAPLIQK